MNRKVAIVVLVTAAVAAGCGGGSNSNSSGPRPIRQTSDSRSPSVARQWNEALLDSIRKDLARPTVHARPHFLIRIPYDTDKPPDNPDCDSQAPRE